jgi:hypothetical protein
MKNIALLVLSVFTAGVLASCCCQGTSAPKLAKMPRFHDLSMPDGGGDVAPIVFKSKK